MISPTGILMDVMKTKAISDWPVPSNLKQVQIVQSFLSFANFYWHFIINFSNMVIPLTQLTRKDTKFEGWLEHQAAFEKLKLAFMQALILSHFNPQDPIVVETNASDYTVVAILSHISPTNGNIHPLAFYSCGMAPAKLNYKIYDKELLAIFDAFQQWWNYLKGSTHMVLVLSDHKNLEYFTTTKQLTFRQVHWSGYLSGFNYLIHYRTGHLGTKPDALMHCEDVYP